MKYFYIIYAILCSLSIQAQQQNISDKNISQLIFQRRSQTYIPDSSCYYRNKETDVYKLRLLKSDIGFRPSKIVVIGTGLRGTIKGKGITPDNDQNTSTRLSATLPADRFINATIVYDEDKRYYLPEIEIIPPIVPSPFRDTASFIWLFGLVVILFGLLLFISFRKYSFVNRKDDVLQLIEEEKLSGIVFRFSLFTLLGAMISAAILSQLLHDRIYHLFSFAVMGVMVGNFVLILLFFYTSFKLRSIPDDFSALHSKAWLFALFFLLVIGCPYLIQTYYVYLPISILGFTTELFLSILIIGMGSQHLRSIRTNIQSDRLFIHDPINFVNDPSSEDEEPFSYVNLEQSISSITHCIAKNNTGQAFTHCHTLLAQPGFSNKTKLQSELVLLESRYHQWRTERRSAGIRPDELEITRNAINKDLLDFVHSFREV